MVSLIASYILRSMLLKAYTRTKLHSKSKLCDVNVKSFTWKILGKREGHLSNVESIYPNTTQQQKTIYKIRLPIARYLE